MAKNYVIPDEVYEKLVWVEIDVGNLAGELAGACVRGVETTTDGKDTIGIILCAEKRSGDMIAVEMLWEMDMKEFLITVADIPMESNRR